MISMEQTVWYCTDFFMISLSRLDQFAIVNIDSHLFGEYFSGDEILLEDRMKIQQLILWGEDGEKSNNDLVPFIIGDKFSRFDILLSVSFLFWKIWQQSWWLSSLSIFMDKASLSFNLTAKLVAQLLTGVLIVFYHGQSLSFFLICVLHSYVSMSGSSLI